MFSHRNQFLVVLGEICAPFTIITKYLRTILIFCATELDAYFALSTGTLKRMYRTVWVLLYPTEATPVVLGEDSETVQGNLRRVYRCHWTEVRRMRHVSEALLQLRG